MNVKPDMDVNPNLESIKIDMLLHHQNENQNGLMAEDPQKLESNGGQQKFQDFVNLLKFQQSQHANQFGQTLSQIPQMMNPFAKNLVGNNQKPMNSFSQIHKNLMQPNMQIPGLNPFLGMGLPGQFPQFDNLHHQQELLQMLNNQSNIMQNPNIQAFIVNTAKYIDIFSQVNIKTQQQSSSLLSSLSNVANQLQQSENDPNFSNYQNTIEDAKKQILNIMHFSNYQKLIIQGITKQLDQLLEQLNSQNNQQYRLPMMNPLNPMMFGFPGGMGNIMEQANMNNFFGNQGGQIGSTSNEQQVNFFKNMVEIDQLKKNLEK